MGQENRAARRMQKLRPTRSAKWGTFGWSGCRVAVGLMLLAVGSVEAADWIALRGGWQRRGEAAVEPPWDRLRAGWIERSPCRPRTAWPGPARWDAYARVSQLAWMRDYDAAFHAVVVGNRVYYGSSIDDAVHCLDARTGHTLWRSVTGGPIRSSPAVAGDRLLIGSDDGYLYAFDLRDGRRLWRYRPAPIADRPLVLHNGRFISRWPCRTGAVVAGQTVYAAFALFPWRESYLARLDLQTGTPIGGIEGLRRFSGETFEGPMAVWKTKLIIPRGRIEPLVLDRTTFQPGRPLSGGGGSFVAVAHGGTILHGPGNKTGWLVETPPAPTAGSQPPKPVKHASFVAAALTDRTWYLAGPTRVVAWEPAARRVLWSAPVSGAASVAAGPHTIWVGATDQLVALDRRSGAAQRRWPVSGRVLSMALTERYLVAATDDGSLYQFEASEDAPRKVAKTARSRPRKSARAAAPRTSEPAPPRLAGMTHWWNFRRGMEAYAVRRGLPDPPRHVRDEVGDRHGRIQGVRSIWQGGGIEAQVFDGQSYVSIASSPREAGLPRESITVEAWARVDQPLPWGGIFSALQDNGSDEHGILLGYVNQSMVFGLCSQGGPGRLTYLKAKQRFELRRWYHVVGTYDGKTQRVFVDGKLAAEATVQRGPIDYPAEAPVVIGAYRDRNEDFRMQGMVHEVRIYKRALSSAEIERLYRATAGRIPREARLAAGPWMRYTGPRRIEVRWETKPGIPSALRWQQGNANGDVSSDAGQRLRQVTFDVPRIDRTVRFVIEEGPADRQRTTDRFELDPNFNYTLPGLPSRTPPKRPSWAAFIGRQHRAAAGVAIVFDARSTERLIELAASSRLCVTAVVRDADRAAAMRRALVKEGAYGLRIAVRSWTGGSQWPAGVADLVVAPPDVKLSPEDRRALKRLVRPDGGTLWLPEKMPTEAPSAAGDRVVIDGTAYRRWRRPAPAGSSDWTHLYGRPDNTSFTGETLGGATSVEQFRVQWIGLPGPRAQPDRTGRKPSPLAAGGRLYVQGLDRIAALNAYNGTVLWGIELPGLNRFNLPRDCSNWCADERRLYVALRDRCIVIDGARGELVRTVRLPSKDRSDDSFAWGYVARAGRMLFGTAVRSDAPFRDYWGKFGWYDARSGPETEYVCGDRLFAFDSTTFVPQWRYERGVILHPTITITDDTVYFAECLDPAIKSQPVRRLGSDRLWPHLVLVALDRHTGKMRWERPWTGPQGKVAFFVAAASDRVVTTASHDKVVTTIAVDAATGKPVWEATTGWPEGKGDHGKALARPAIVGDRVFVRPDVFELHRGKRLAIRLPYGKCGTYACSSKMIFFRHQTVSAWSPETEKLAGWRRLRPDCWLSTIPAFGMVLSPEAGGGCSCGVWFEASLGFVPVERESRVGGDR